MGMFNNNYIKSEYKPKHKEKCLNYNGRITDTKPIICRSSWEKIMCNWCDLNNDILEWGSEIIEIPYYSQIDNKQHRYITDFIFVCKDRTGEKQKWLVEIKPKSQVPIIKENGEIKFPELKKNKRLTKKRIDEWQEYCTVLKRNKEKWDFARDWCRRNGYKFKVLTEHELRT